MSNELIVTSTTNDDVIANESLFVVLKLFHAPERVLRLYKLLRHHATNENEKDIALKEVEKLGYGSSKVQDMINVFNRSLEKVQARQTPDTRTKTQPTTTKKTKKKVNKIERCAMCNERLKKETKHVLPHNYGGLRRKLLVCTDCLPNVISVIGHRVSATAKPLWR